MAVFSARFALLACLCAVIPLTPSVEAAYIHGGDSVGKHISPPRSPKQENNPPLFDGPTTAHRHDGKYNGHQTQGRRPPPLLRHFRAHDPTQVHNHGQDPDDSSRDKTSRSAFARSRYRRASGTLRRRVSVLVPGVDGGTYIVSRTRSRDLGHLRADAGKQSSHAYNRRQIDGNELAMGRIDIMIAAQSRGGTQRLASLTVDSTPIDWKSGQNSAKAFPLNASTANQTQFIMVPMDDSDTGEDLYKHVALATEVFDPSSAEMVMYCATYDPNPGQPSALLMVPCTGTAQDGPSADDAADPCTGDGADAASSNPHQSQIFSYDPFSGKIEPMAAAENSPGVGSSTNDAAPCVGAKVRRDTNNNSTTNGVARPSSTTTLTAPTATPSQQAQNVTLVYVAIALEVPAASPNSSVTSTSTSPQSSMAKGQAAVVTTTITTTVVATVSASSGISRPAVSPAKAAVSVATPSIPSLPTTVAAPSAQSASTSSATTATTASTTQSSLSTSSTASTATTPTPANADESLEVEVIGVTPSTTAGASSASATTTTIATTKSTATTTTTSYGSVSPTLDPVAVASMIEDQMPHQRRGVVEAGASVA